MPHSENPKVGKRGEALAIWGKEIHTEVRDSLSACKGNKTGKESTGGNLGKGNWDKAEIMKFLLTGVRFSEGQGCERKCMRACVRPHMCITTHRHETLGVRELTDTSNGLQTCCAPELFFLLKILTIYFIRTPEDHFINTLITALALTS